MQTTQEHNRTNKSNGNGRKQRKQRKPKASEPVNRLQVEQGEPEVEPETPQAEAKTALTLPEPLKAFEGVIKSAKAHYAMIDNTDRLNGKVPLSQRDGLTDEQRLASATFNKWCVISMGQEKRELDKEMVKSAEVLFGQYKAAIAETRGLAVTVQGQALGDIRVVRSRTVERDRWGLATVVEDTIRANRRTSTVDRLNEARKSAVNFQRAIAQLESEIAAESA